MSAATTLKVLNTSLFPLSLVYSHIIQGSVIRPISFLAVVTCLKDKVQMSSVMYLSNMLTQLTQTKKQLGGGQGKTTVIITVLIIVLNLQIVLSCPMVKQQSETQLLSVHKHA